MKAVYCLLALLAGVLQCKPAAFESTGSSTGIVRYELNAGKEKKEAPKGVPGYRKKYKSKGLKLVVPQLNGQFVEQPVRFAIVNYVYNCSKTLATTKGVLCLRGPPAG